MLRLRLLPLIGLLLLYGPTRSGAQVAYKEDVQVDLSLVDRREGFLMVRGAADDAERDRLEQAAMAMVGVVRRSGEPDDVGAGIRWLPVAMPVAWGPALSVRMNPAPMVSLVRNRGYAWLLVVVHTGRLPVLRTVGLQRDADGWSPTYHATLETDKPSPRLQVDLGYPVGQTVGWLLAALLAALVSAATFSIIWRRLGEAPDEGGRQAAFRTLYAVQVVTQGTWVAWLACSLPFRPDRLVGFTLGTPPDLAVIALGAAYLGPPVLASLVAAAIGHPAVERLRGNHWSRGGLVAMEACRLGQSLLPLLLLAMGLGAIPSRNWALAGLGLAAAYPVHRGLLLAYMRHAGYATTQVTEGPLFERILELAGRAGVPMRRVIVMLAGRGALVNAYAPGRGQIVVTRDLLTSLTRREVDAILAHELGHLKHNHAGILAGLAAGPVIAACFLYFAVFTEGVRLEPVLLMLLAALLFLPVSQAFERTADRLAIAYCQDPEAMITALATLTRLNGSPLDWQRSESRLYTHPSTLRRAQAIGQLSGIAPERVQELVGSRLGDDQYQLPDEVGASTVSQRLQEWRRDLASAVVRAAVVGVPVGLAVVPTTGPVSWARPVALVAAVCLLLGVAHVRRTRRPGAGQPDHIGDGPAPGRSRPSAAGTRPDMAMAAGCAVVVASVLGGPPAPAAAIAMVGAVVLSRLLR